MRNLRVLTLLFFTVICVSANAQVVKEKQGYLLMIKYKKGKVYKQTVAMKVVNNSKLGSSSVVVTKCLDVDKQGIATLEITTPSNAGNIVDVKKIKVDRFGTPQGNTIQGFSGNFAWPEKHLKVGEKWTGDMNLNETSGGSGGANFILKATYKFVGIQTVNNVKVATVTANLKVGGMYDISGTGTIHIRVDDGQVHVATFNMAMNQFSNTNKQGKLNLVMTLKSA